MIFKNKKIWVFILFIILISTILDFFIIKSGTIKAGGGAFGIALAWTPGISALLTLLIFKQSLKTIRWTIGKIKYLIKAYFIPLLYISLAYLPLWMLGYFNSDKQLTIKSILIPLFGAFVNIVATLGEEIGWRGFLFPQIEKNTTFTKASLLTGFIWAIWHIPVLLWTEYGNNVPWYTALPFFIIILTAISYPMAYLCKMANSIWPAVLFHAAHNAFIQAFYDPFSIKNKTTQFLIGETGLALVITSIIVLIIFLKKNKFNFLSPPVEAPASTD